MPFHAVVAAGIVLAALAAPVQASEKRYFECPSGGSKFLNMRADPSGWTAAAPTISFSSGAGCGYLTTGSNGHSTTIVTDRASPVARFAGTYTGSFDALNVELWELGLSHAYDPDHPGQDFVTYKVTVDGAVVAEGSRLLSKTRSLEGRTQRYVLALQDLDVPKGVHDVALEIVMGSDTWDAAALVFGASEVPGHVEFIPAD